jgi:serpin B
MRDIILLGIVIAIIGVCESQRQSNRPSFGDDDSYGFQSWNNRRGGSERNRGSFGPEDYEAQSYNKWRPNGGDRNERISNCRRTDEQFETGFCSAIPDDRDLESASDDQALSADITEFALQLFKAANKHEVGNMVISGISPQVLLSYLAWTAEGDTRKQMQKAKVPGTPKNIQKLVSRMQQSTDKRELNIATAFFRSTDVVMNKDFMIKSSDKVDIVKVDFKNSATAANTIKKWATQKTKGKLDLSGITFPIDTKLALVNTLYFSGKWYFKFENVTQEDFNLGNGQKVKVPMMKIKKKYNYGKIGDIAEWGAIPYESREAMVIILPKEGTTIDQTIERLTNEDITNICDSARSDYTSAELTLSLPQFKLSSTTNLVEPLKKMGIHKIFTPSAELPYLAKDSNIQVSDVEQKSALEVNQDGTIVVTYTNINAVALSIQRDPPKVTFTVDRPFIAMVCDVNRQLPFVMAKISDPSQEYQNL